MNKTLSLAAGSLAGGFARYWLAGAVYARLGADFPYGTLVVNLTACALIGLFNALSESKFLLGPETRLLLMTGFCGAYSTFSTLILETSNQLQDGQWLLAGANILASLILGLAAFKAGTLLGKVI